MANVSFFGETDNRMRGKPWALLEIAMRSRNAGLQKIRKASLQQKQKSRRLQVASQESREAEKQRVMLD